jgi:class 3 adenylate cyclase
VRIGIHTGEAIHRSGDFFGRSVILAARIAAHAQGGDILTSSLARELVAERGDIELRDAGEAEFKGLDGRHRLYEVAWAPTTTLTLSDDPAPAPPSRNT